MSSLTEIQELFRSSLARHLAGLADRSEDASRERWASLVELGALAAVVPEDRGGLGGPAEMQIVSRELGYAGSMIPMISRGVLPALFYSNWPAGEAAQAGVLDGDVIVTAVPRFGTNAGGASVICNVSGNSAYLSGEIRHIEGLAGASALLFAARRPNGSGDMVLQLPAEILDRVIVAPTIDQAEHAFLVFRNTEVPLSCILPEDALPAFMLASDSALVAQCAELLGNIQRMFDLTREYLGTRRQFGQALSEFQALRHRLADMFAELDQAQAMLGVGASALQEMSASKSAYLASACKVRTSQAARFIGAQAIQLHGAIGMTEEYELGRLYRRSIVLRKLWGDDDVHAKRMTVMRGPAG